MAFHRVRKRRIGNKDIFVGSGLLKFISPHIKNIEIEPHPVCYAQEFNQEWSEVASNSAVQSLTTKLNKHAALKHLLRVISQHTGSQNMKV